jgi:hypothetical protein
MERGPGAEFSVAIAASLRQSRLRHTSGFSKTIHQQLDPCGDERPGNIEVVTDRWAIIPVLKRLAGSDEPFDVATKGNDVIRPCQGIGTDEHWAHPSNIDTLAQ